MLAVTPFLTGDPVRPDGSIASIPDVAAALGREGVERAGLLPLAPGVALVHVLTVRIAAGVAILLVLILVPPFPRVFGLGPLSFAEWGVLLLFPPVLLGLEEARKWVVRRTDGRGGH